MPQNTTTKNLLKTCENGSLLENVEFTKPLEADSEIQSNDKKNGRFKTYILPVLLVFYSIIKEFKVGEPFLYKYHSENLNYTAEILNGEVYPYSAYSYLFAIIPIFLFTDILLYKPIMYIEIFGQISYRFTLSYTSSLFSQQLGQTMGGLVRASDLAFFSYIYGVLEKDQYKRFTSWTRAGTMAGRTGAYLFSQILILTHWSDYHTMNKMAFYIASTALIVCFFLPRLRWKTMVERISQAKTISSNISSSSSNLPKSYSEYVSYRIRRLHSHFKQIYSNPRIRKWSFYWAMTTCMSLQVSLYYQTLFGIVQIGDKTPLNGLADAGYTFVSVILILIMNWYSINWDKWGELALVGISSLSAAFLVIFSQAQTAYPMYACYIAYEAFYQLMITIAQWNIAKEMKCDSYGLVFGVNSFIALLMQSLLTRIVNDKHGFAMDVRNAFLIYAALHAFIAIIFFFSIIYTLFKFCKNKNAKKPVLRKYGISQLQQQIEDGLIETDSSNDTASSNDGNLSTIDSLDSSKNDDFNAHFLQRLQKAQSQYGLPAANNLPLEIPSYSIAESFSTSINNMRTRQRSVLWSTNNIPKIIPRRKKQISANF
uniref:Uncharacterized protein n=1 Tax=Panagrolaimus sp. ES5 TaxID=591445 RepID=A0AC34F781_9BILA